MDSGGTQWAAFGKGRQQSLLLAGRRLVAATTLSRSKDVSLLSKRSLQKVLARLS